MKTKNSESGSRAWSTRNPAFLQTRMKGTTAVDAERKKNVRQQRIKKCSSSTTVIWMIAMLSMGTVLWATVDHRWAMANAGLALSMAAMIKIATSGGEKSKAIAMAMGMLQIQRGMAGLGVAWGEGLVSAIATTTSSTLPAMASVLWSVHQMANQVIDREEIVMANGAEGTEQMTIPTRHHISWGEMVAVVSTMFVTISICCAASGTHRVVRNSYLKMATTWNLIAWVAMQLIPVVSVVVSQEHLWWQPSRAMLKVWEHGWEH